MAASEAMLRTLLIAASRGGEFALVVFQRGVGLVPQLLRRGQIALDLVLAFVEQAADARQRNSRDDQIKRDKGHQQRHQLRSKGVLLERRKRGLVAAVRLGMGRRALCVAMTLSHGLLLFGRLRSGSRTSSARSVMNQSANSSSSATSSSSAVSATVSPSGRMAPTQPTKPNAPSMVTKLANTFSVMWPASMLANRRTLCETGRDRNEMISISTTSGRM